MIQVLNDNPDRPIPKCPDGEHEFITTREPDNHRSGWHEEKCKKCGYKIGYDTSD